MNSKQFFLHCDKKYPSWLLLDRKEKARQLGHTTIYSPVFFSPWKRSMLSIELFSFYINMNILEAHFFIKHAFDRYPSSLVLMSMFIGAVSCSSGPDVLYCSMFRWTELKASFVRTNPVCKSRDTEPTGADMRSTIGSKWNRLKLNTEVQLYFSNSFHINCQVH